MGPLKSSHELPVGLSAAWDLAIEGFGATVFELLPVAGGGNSAIDAARVALRKGAGEVRVLYRR